jgi:hypothetical protein
MPPEIEARYWAVIAFKCMSMDIEIFKKYAYFGFAVNFDGRLRECKVNWTPLLGMGYHVTVYLNNALIGAHVQPEGPSMQESEKIAKDYIEKPVEFDNVTCLPVGRPHTDKLQ